MGTSAADLSGRVDTVFGTKWDERDGQVVPETEDVALKDGAVKLDAVFLYADLAGSSKLAAVCPWGTTAKVIRAYLDVATRLIRAYGGHVRSFDGDRVMGVFIGKSPNTDASYCARELDYAVHKIIGPKAVDTFASIRNNDIKIRHCVGIDVGVARAVRAGIRNSNDLIWVGKAPSFAAKLSDIRTYPYSVYLSARSYGKLAADAKAHDGKDLWEKRSFEFNGETEDVYRTKWLKTP
jgi:class 3 adenylate cyclase